MTRRARIALRSVGILLGFLALSLVVRVLTAREERLAQTVRVSSRVEVGPNRFLVKLAPEDVSQPLPVEAVTVYPFGLAVVEAGGAGAPGRPPARPVPVRTTRLVPGPVVRKVVGFGTVEATRDARVSVETAGVVQRVRFTLGEVLAEGAPLVELDARDAQLRVRRAEGELARAQAGLGRATDSIASMEAQLATAQAALEVRLREVERWRTLAAQDLASRDRLDQADMQWRAAVWEAQRMDASLEGARSGLEEAKAAATLAAVEQDAARLALERCVLRAPFAGAVAERLVQEGQWVAAGTPALRLVSTDRVRVRLHVREDDALGVAPGAEATVSLPGVAVTAPTTYAGSDSPQDGLPGRVEGVARAADPKTRTFAVDVVTTATDVLRPGMFARVVLHGGTVLDAVLVPDSAVSAEEDGQHVFVVEGDVVKRVAVTLGPRQGEARLLRGGLGANAEVVVEGINLLFDDAPITRVER